MTEVDELLASNQRYRPAGGARPDDARPQRHIALVTCMDTRIDPLAVLGLELGEAHVLRNAGGRVTDDVLRSLALSVHVLGVRTVVVMHHTQCGLAGTTDDELRRRTGAGFDFYPISDHAQALGEDIGRLASTPVLGPVGAAAGVLLDINTGLVQRVAQWSRED
jgi:carbonic anhydrase